MTTARSKSLLDNTLEDAKKKLAKIMFAYERMPKVIRATVGLKRYGVPQLQVNQIAWYAKMLAEHGRDDMMSEYPSHIGETFFNSIEGAFFKQELSRAREDKRIGLPVPFDPNRPVNTFWDIGMDDETAIWFHQTTACGTG